MKDDGLEVIIAAEPEEVFSFFRHPAEVARVSGALPVQGLSGVPAISGTTWHVRRGLFGHKRTNFKVTTCNEPSTMVIELTESVRGTIGYHFHRVGRANTQVVVTMEMAHLPWYLSRADLRVLQRRYLDKIREHFATVVPAREKNPALNPAEAVRRVSVVGPPFRRKTVLFRVESQINTSPEVVFARAVDRVDDFWEWMIDRSDPNIELEVAAAWPTEGSCYTYRRRNRTSISGWETGTVKMLGCRRPFFADTLEEQRLPLLKGDHRMTWTFEPAGGKTHVSVAYELFMRNWAVNLLVAFLARRLAAHFIEVFEGQLENLRAVAEREAGLPQRETL